MKSALFLSLIALAALAQERGRLVGLRAGGDAGASSIELIGDRPLSFTTLKLPSPPRVVVDFADTEVAADPRVLTVEDGTVKRVVAAAAGQRTARVVIELAAEAEFDVRAHGNGVEVRVPRVRPLVASAEQPRSEAAPGEIARADTSPAANGSAAVARPAGEAGAAANGASSEGATRGVSSQAAEAAAGGAPSQTGDAPVQAGEDAPAPTSAGAGNGAVARNGGAASGAPAQTAEASNGASAQAAREAGEPREAASSDKPALPTVALVPAHPPHEPTAAEKAKAERDRVAAEKAARLSKAAAAKQAAAEKAARAKQAAAEKAARAKQAAAEKAARARQAAAEKAERARLAKAEKAARAKRLAAERADARLARTARGRKPVQLAMAARHFITGIGFRPINGGEVIVRSDHPLEYGVSGEGDAVLLHLPAAAIPLENNRRPLDTRFFGGPVQRIVPVPVADGTDVRIELSGHAEYQLAQSGTVLTVTFSAHQ